MNVRPLSVLAAGLLLATSAQALTLTVDSNVIGLQPTDWVSALTVPRFSGPGTLSEVRIELHGLLTGVAEVESTDSAPATVRSTLSAALTLTRPDKSLLLVTLPTQTWTLKATAFDSLSNAAGGSGAAWAIVDPLVRSEVANFSVAADLALFSGEGNLVLPVSASDLSITAASGNIEDSYMSQAGAWARVTYTYAAAPVPEPGTWALLLVGLAVTGFAARRRAG